MDDASSQFSADFSACSDANNANEVVLCCSVNVPGDACMKGAANCKIRNRIVRKNIACTWADKVFISAWRVSDCEQAHGLTSNNKGNNNLFLQEHGTDNNNSSPFVLYTV